MRCSLLKCQVLTPQGKTFFGYWGRGTMQAERNRWENGLYLKFQSKWPREEFHPELLLASHCMSAARRQLQTPKCAFLLPPTIIQLSGTKLGTGISVLTVTPACVLLGLHSREEDAGLGCSWGRCLPSGSLEHPALLCACLGLLLPVLWTQWQGALAPGMSPDKSAVFFILSGI